MSVFSSFNFEKYKGVLVDFDNTLYEYAPCHQAGLNAVYKDIADDYHISYEDFLAQYSVAQKEVKTMTKHQAASHSRFLYFQKMLEALEGATNIEKTIHYEEVYWRAFGKEVVLRKEVVDFLVECRKRGLQLCLITDLTASVQFRKMVTTGVHLLVDYVVTSEEAGVEKPDQAIFRLALQKLGLTEKEVVMIGDDTLKDKDGANKLGITAYLV